MHRQLFLAHMGDNIEAMCNFLYRVIFIVKSMYYPVTG